MDIVERFIEIARGVTVKAADIFSISPIDLLIVFILFGMLLGFSFRYGKQWIITLIFSLYFASFVSMQFPYTDRILGSQAGNIELTALIVAAVFTFFIIIYVIFNRITRSVFPSGSSLRWVEAGALSLVTTGLILALSYHVVPVTEVYDFSLPLDRLFEPPEYFFWWLIIPLAVLLFVGKRSNDIEE